MKLIRILHGTKESRARYCFRRVSPTIEVPKEVDKSLDEYKRVGHDELLEVLPSMEDNHHHDTVILHDFEDLFMQKENSRDESFQFFKFISPTIGTWTQRKHDPSLSYMDCDEDF